MIWNCYEFRYFLSIFWHKPFRDIALKFLDDESLRMSKKKLFPEHRIWCEYLSLFTLLWFNEKKILKSEKINSFLITHRENIVISTLSMGRI